jgi:CHAT domain-containing protein
MPMTPEQMPLPFVEKEINAIKATLEIASIPTTIQMNAVRLDALSKLPKHAIAHFACHGCSENDPSASNMLL